MIKTFADKRTKDLYDTGRAKQFPPDVAGRAARKLEYVDLATQIDDLKVPPGNRLHALEGVRKGRHSISINDQWRICFRFVDGDAYDVEVCDYHRERDEMPIANTGPTKRRPTHPGEMLREDFLPDYGLTVSKLARAIGVSRQSVNELLRGRRAVSPEMALRLAKLFGNSPEFWLNAQRAVDLWDAVQAIKDNVAGIKTLSVAS
jgi:addiction module HigA family antidote